MILIRFMFRLICLVPLAFFMLFPIEFNKDYSNYERDYNLVNNAYDLLYEFFSHLLRDYVGLSFHSFWIVLLAMELILIAIYYSKIRLLILAYPSLIAMSQFFYGTQVRYALAILLGLVVIKYAKKNIIKLFFVMLATLFHYGAIISLFPLMIAKKTNDKWFLLFSGRNFVFIILAISVSLFSGYYFNGLLQMTRFSYYLAASEYLVSKSLISILYAVISLTLIIILYYNNKVFRCDLIKQCIILLIMVLMFGSIAVLSGRMIFVYFIIEPAMILYSFNVMFSSGNQIGKLICFALFVMYLIRCINSIVTSDFYFYNIL